MSHTYAERKEADGAPRQTAAAKERPLSDQHLDALRRGAEGPTAADMGHRIELSEAMRAKMESAFGTDLSAVKLYRSQAVADAGAQAVARGSSIAFAPAAAVDDAGCVFRPPSGQNEVLADKGGTYQFMGVEEGKTPGTYTMKVRLLTNEAGKKRGPVPPDEDE